MGRKISNDISESKQQIHSPKLHALTPLEGPHQTCQSCSKNCEILNFGFFNSFFISVLAWDHMGVKASNIFSEHAECTQQVHSPKFMFTSHASRKVAGPKLLKELWNLKFWIFDNFFFLLFFCWCLTTCLTWRSIGIIKCAISRKWLII